jgi:cob(I)alamin adenosyltransferase
MPVHLTRIYTRAGDSGGTRLVDNSETTKNDPRLAAFADVDEANSAIGAAVALGDLPADITDLLTLIQNELFDVGADLGNPVVADPPVEPLRITAEAIEKLEAACDHWNEQLQPLHSFVLPGGSAGASLLHVARTVVRRAERTAWAAIAEFGDAMNPLTAVYLNRVSDLLFVLARVANLPAGDRLWVPGATRDGSPTSSEPSG